MQTLPGLDVLVVDDNAPNRNILAEMLTNWRMSPVLAEDGASALRAMEAARQQGRPFPIVLLDAQMPGMDGFRVMERIRDNPSRRRRDLDVVCGTPSDGRHEVPRAWRQGIPYQTHRPIRVARRHLVGTGGSKR